MKIIIDMADPRPLMEWHVPYQVLGGACSVARCGGPATTAIRWYVESNRLMDNSKGRLLLYCEAHGRLRAVA